jgi:hypothetical protein
LYKTFQEVVDELKTQAGDLKHLKKNQDLYDKVKAELPMLEARLDPIKKKFAYIEEQEQELNITEED